MGYFSQTAKIAAALMVLSAPVQLFAQESEDKLIAKIEGVEIRQSDFAIFEGLDPQFEQLQGEQKTLAILSALIDVKSLAKQAESEKYDQSNDFQKRMTFLKDRSLHNAYFRDKVLDNTSDEELRARFDQEMANVPVEKEVRARHILVKTEDEAKAIIADLDGGTDFEELAKSKSTGPSGPNGGDLGFFGQGQMVPEFEAAAFAMKAGEYSKTPVKTQFGFHVIKVEEARDRPLPKFEELKPQMQQLVLREKYLALVKQARDNISIEIVDEALKETYEKVLAEQDK